VNTSNAIIPTAKSKKQPQTKKHRNIGPPNPISGRLRGAAPPEASSFEENLRLIEPDRDNALNLQRFYDDMPLDHTDAVLVANAAVVAEPTLSRRCNRSPPNQILDYDYAEFIDSNPSYINLALTSVAQQAYALSLRVKELAHLVAEPKSLQKALGSHTHKDEWDQAIKSEIKSLSDNNTLLVLRRPPGTRSIGTKWVFKVKADVLGYVDRFKARCTALGNLQREGIDYNETFSPVVRHSSLRTLLAISAQRNLVVHQMDVDTAFLYGELPLDELPVYIDVPYGYPIPDELKHTPLDQLVCKAIKGIYGLKQSPRLWNANIHATMIRLGYTQFPSEPCMYRKGTDAKEIFVAIYVDDLVIATADVQEMQSFKNELFATYKMKDLGPIRHLLGMEVVQDIAAGTIKITQSNYIEEVLRRFGMLDCKVSNVPMVASLSLTKALVNEDAYPYAEVIGSLLYMTTCTRPDITYAVNILSKYIACHDKTHSHAAKVVMSYLSGTKDQGITFKRTDSSRFKLKAFTDSDWAADKDTRRSVTGYIFFLGESPISWKSKSQPTVALSSTEAEYMALASTTQEMMYLRALCLQFGVPEDLPVILGDNMSALALVSNPVHHARTKHIDIRHHYCREALEAGIIDYQYVNTLFNVADTFTKALPYPQFVALRDKMFNRTRGLEQTR
jgi:hypothetical protein